jgi:hypothetical protein
MTVARWLVCNDPEISTDRLEILARPSMAIKRPVPGRTAYWAIDTWA